MLNFVFDILVIQPLYQLKKLREPAFMTDLEIIDKLINGDEDVSRKFFFENCRPLIVSIINHVFPYQVEYDEFVNELYIYLMGNDAARLRKFEGRSSIYQWLKTVALRFALELRKKGLLIDGDSKEPLYGKDPSADSTNDGSWKLAKMDIETLLGRMRNERQVYVIRRHLIDGISEPALAEELGVKVSNLYNIKKRAMNALMEVALTDIQQYGKTNK